jgi:Fe-S-cluster containining protein
VSLFHARLNDATLPEIREAVIRLCDEAKDACAADGTPTTCTGKGCYGCCHGNIPVTREEVRALAGHVSDDAWDRLSAMEVSQEKGTTHRCPLLDPAEKTCTVWDVAPLVCRSFSVISAPELCFRERHGEDEPVKGVMHTEAQHFLKGLGLQNRRRPLVWRLHKERSARP